VSIRTTVGQVNLPTSIPSTKAGVRPGLPFVAVVLAFVFGAWLCLQRPDGSGLSVFIFVMAGWVLSLIFHEFAHAFTAWKGGDLSIPSKGYLTLNPLLYADPFTSVLLPIFILFIGGIGLPGGAVWIDQRALRSRGTASIVSLAGPFTNLALAALLITPVSFGMVTNFNLSVAMAFLGFVQIFAFVINMLPVPGLDGFGALEPHLPPSVLQAIAPFRRYSMLILIAVVLWFEPGQRLLSDIVNAILNALGLDTRLVSLGWTIFRFWEGGTSF